MILGHAVSVVTFQLETKSTWLAKSTNRIIVLISVAVMGIRLASVRVSGDKNRRVLSGPIGVLILGAMSSSA